MNRVTAFDGCSWCPEEILSKDPSSVRHVETERRSALSDPAKEQQEHKLLSEIYGVQLPPQLAGTISSGP